MAQTALPPVARPATSARPGQDSGGPRWLRRVAALASGALLALAFPPYNLWPLAFVGCALLALALQGVRARTGALLGLVHGMAFFLVLLPWLQIIGVDAWIGLSLLETAFFLPLGAALAVITRLPLWPLPWAGLWVAQEAARGRAPFGGFPWGNLAFSQTDSPLTPLAAVGGAPLLSFTTALAGSALAATVLLLAGALLPGRAVRRRPVLGWLAVVAALPVAAVVVPLPTDGDREATVAVVQGNVPRSGLDFDGQRAAVLRNHVAATERLAADVAAGRVQRPEAVILPENASDIDPFTNQDAYRLIDGAVRAVGVPTLVGVVATGPGPNHVSNTGVVWDPQSGPGARYAKRHLVPFGEYIPFRSTLSQVFSRLQRIPRDFAPGTVPGSLQVGSVRVADVICFEVAYDGVVRDAVRAGSQVLVVQTNNATYGRTGQPQQQLAISRLRAVEHGRAVLVAATSGISAIIAPDGRIVARTSEFTSQVLVEAVPLRSGSTLATRLGRAPELVLSAAGVACLLLALARSRRTGRPARSVR